MFLFFCEQKETTGKVRKLDDSHKYPLRKSAETGFLAEEAEAASSLSASASGSPSLPSGAVGVATGSSASSSNGHDAGGGGGGGGGGGSGNVSSKQKGYEVHMAALGKLGAGSAGSRLFPKPGKKILRAVGQAVQASLSKSLAYLVFSGVSSYSCYFSFYFLALSPCCMCLSISSSSSSSPSSVLCVRLCVCFR